MGFTLKEQSVKVILVTLNRSLACKGAVDVDACGDVLHAVVACVNAQRGGFSGFAHAADPFSKIAWQAVHIDSIWQIQGKTLKVLCQVGDDIVVYSRIEKVSILLRKPRHSA